MKKEQREKRGKVIKVSNVQELMIEAQQENIVEFRTDSSGSDLENNLISTFPNITIKSSSEQSIRISSDKKIELMPFMNFFDKKKINEAKIIHPSLEEVFVKITGIEIDKLKKEKEGKKK